MSNAISGIGTKFYRWDADSPAAWEAIAEINSIDGPGMTRGTIDVTSLDSEGGYMEFIAAIRDAGSVSLQMNFQRSTYEIMKNDFEDESPQNYKIVLPDEDETTLEFEGLVTELPLSITVTDKITCDVTVKISGKPVLKDGSSSAP